MNHVSTSRAVSAALSRDPFLEQFFSRLPEAMHTDFTDRQLAALKSVFGDATRSGHGFDIRLNIPTPLIGRGAYVVLLGGRDRRSGTSRSSARGLGNDRALGNDRGLATFGKLIFGGLFIAQLAVVAVTLAIWLL